VRARQFPIDMTRQRTDGKDIAPHRDSSQFGDLADIDDEFRRDQTQVHRGHQALAARQHLRLVPVRDQQLQRVRHAGRACVAESRGFHWRDLPGGFFRVFLKGLDGGNHQRSRLFIERLFREIRLLDLWYRGQRRTVWLAIKSVPGRSS
jgi:hypothetical protein